MAFLKAHTRKICSFVVVVMIALFALVLTACGTTTTNYTVTYDSGEGSAVDNTVVVKGYSTDLPTPVRSGYTFDGWFETADCSSARIIAPYSPTANTKLYALWTENGSNVTRYTVNFQSNYGEEVDSVSVLSTVKVKLPTPIKDGNTFTGWHASSELTDDAVDGEFTPTSNITLYAAYEYMSVEEAITAPGAMWHWFILEVFSFVSDYGWRIVVFTVIIKLILSPLDVFQRYKMDKNQQITERLKPTMEKLQKQYANDKQGFSQAQMALNRKEGYSYFSSCLPMIVTMVVFLTLWMSLTTVAQYMTVREYAALYDRYNLSYSREIENGASETAAQEIAQQDVYTLYYEGYDGKEKQETSFLWIQNVWAPDVPWGDQAILSYAAFDKAADKYGNIDRNGLTPAVNGALFNEATYNRVMSKLLNSGHDRTNGYLILPILVILLSVGTQLLQTTQQKKAGQVNQKGGMATTMKVMMFVMPVMMAVFATMYSAIFALYMVMSSFMSLAINLLSTLSIKLINGAKRKRALAAVTTGKPSKNVTHYGRPDPNALLTNAPETKKKDKKDKTKVVSSRPDPTALVGEDSKTRADKKKKDE